MQQAAAYAKAKQQEINRTLQPQIKERMSAGYKAAASADKGKGFMKRMESALKGHAEPAMGSMLSDSTREMLEQSRRRGGPTRAVRVKSAGREGCAVPFAFDECPGALVARALTSACLTADTADALRCPRAWWQSTS